MNKDLENVILERSNEMKKIAREFGTMIGVMNPKIKNSTSKEWDGIDYRFVEFLLKAAKHNNKGYLGFCFLDKNALYPTEELHGCIELNGKQYIAIMNDIQAYIRPRKAGEKVGYIVTREDIERYRRFVLSEPILEIWN